MNTARTLAAAFAFLSLSSLASVAAAGTAPGGVLQGHAHIGAEGTVAFIASPTPMMAVDASLRSAGVAELFVASPDAVADEGCPRAQAGARSASITERTEATSDALGFATGRASE